MLADQRDSLTGLALVTIALVAGALTWLCVGWFGHQPALTAMVAVILVEVFLAGVGMILMLVAERVTVLQLASEKRPAPGPKVRQKREPIWFRLPEPAPGSVPPSSEQRASPERQTIPFPTIDPHPVEDELWWHGRAA